jgi:thioredoxin-related protein
MSQTLNRWKVILACALLSVHATTSFAQDAIQWRSSYIEARKEAEAKNLPLFIDFVKVNCPPCTRMEQTTFRDPRIVRTLNEKFVPLRINESDDPKVVGLLQVDRFPTIILADPDGRNRKDAVGYQEADSLHDQLQQVVSRLTPPDTMQRDLANAQTWEAAGDYPRAIAALRMILTDETGRPAQKTARALLDKIELRAADSLAKGRELQTKGKLAEAVEALTDTQKMYVGLQASRDALELISKIEQANVEFRNAQRSKRAQEMLALAEGYYKSKEYMPCLHFCDKILANFGDMPEGQKAFLLADEIKRNPEWLQGASDAAEDRLGSLWLATADSYLKRGEYAKTEFYLKRTIQALPGTRYAESAQIRLTQLQAANPRPVQSGRP